ncbi:MAG: hypothetical protein M3406_16990 [Chloroflexota bacterium]|nr:hypothetical protein [Chloroflexota bacterium]
MTFGRSMIQEILPVRDVRVRVNIPDGRTVTRAYLAPDDQDLEFQVDGEQVDLVVPELHIHSMVVLDLGGSQSKRSRKSKPKRSRKSKR